MHHVALIGAGKIGEAIVNLLGATGDYQLTVVDQDDARLAPMRALGAKTHVVDVANTSALKAAIGRPDSIISACPFYLTPVLAQVAKDLGAHYLDLTEDVESTRVVKSIAEGARTAFIPQCGLAPGFISIAAFDVAKQFESLRDVNMRVGALPIYPTNALKYNLTSSMASSKKPRPLRSLNISHSTVWTTRRLTPPAGWGRFAKRWRKRSLISITKPSVTQATARS
jgi:saccharopine dehydrogenase-like NADP-dependent oxidoreductase